MRLIFWVLFALMLGVYLVMALWSIPKIATDAGGLLPFDVRPMGYSFAQAAEFLNALPDETRAFYANVQHKLDATYPALFAVVMVMAFQKLFQAPMRYYLSVLAVMAAGFDYLENAAVAVLLRTPDADVIEGMVSTASRWTILKSGAVTLALVALLVGLVMAWVRKRKAV